MAENDEIKKEPAAVTPLNLEALRNRAIQQLDQVLPAPTQKRTYSYAELFEKRDEDQRFVIPNLLPADAVCVFIGEDGIGKTQLCTQLCLSIAFGYKSFLGLPLYFQHRRCLVVATEDSRQKFIKAATKQSMTLEPGHNPKDVAIDFTEGSDFDDFVGLKDEMDRLLLQNFYDLIVVDALGDLFTLIDGEINSNSHARKLLSYFQHLCNTYQTTIIIIHHAAKSKLVVKRREGKIFVEKTDSQGAGAITQKPRTVLALTNDPKSIEDEGRRYINYLHVVKANLMGKEFMQNAIKCQFTTTNLLHQARGTVDIELMQNGSEDEQAAATPVAYNHEAPGKKLAPGQITDEKHHAALRIIFRESDVLERGQLVKGIAAHYGVGQVKVESKDGYLAYLLQQGYLQKGTGGAYKYNRPAVTQTWQPVKTDLTNPQGAGDTDGGDEPLEEAPF